MTAYRFCRTDDVPLLVRAHNACISEPIGVPPITVDEFRRWMRELDMWCSSCMVALEGSEPVGVLIAAKRAPASFIHRIGVRPEHRRRGHARHMLESLARKMAILEPRLLLAEVSEEFPDAMRLLEACGYSRGDDLVDHLADPLVDAAAVGDAPASLLRPSPVTLSELDATGALAAEEPATWLRSVAALRAVRDELRGLAFVSDLRIEAWLLYRDGPESAERLVLAVGTGEGAAAGATMKALLPLLLAARRESRRPLRIPRLHSGEIPPAVLAAAGFVPAAAFATYSAEAAPG
ncbi:MAG TPA: GNAT family N-acetyltransferase [Thermoanaerobaculia bacterium]|nr:GNAT family N-acetyltransferase [Thermoanaerobaculia bacterium]